MLYKKIPGYPKGISGEKTAKGKRGSNGIGNLYQLQFVTAGSAVDKCEQFFTPGTQNTLYIVQSGGVVSGKEGRLRRHFHGRGV